MDDAPLVRLREALTGRYLVGGEIGRGGMAAVYRAIDPAGRQVAIKLLDPVISRILGRRFRREIEILRRLQHPNIVPLLDAGESGDLLYYVMPFIEGQTLRVRLRRERQLPLDEALRLTRSILDALAYAHRENVVHRDIKPENILLEDGHPRVADFGIARAIIRSGIGTDSTTGFAIGTPEYMSPEQAAADPGLDARSDLYSTACVLYEMLAGSPPFTGRTPQSIQARHIHEAPPPLLVVRPQLPPGLVAVVERGLAKAPADRHQTAESFAEELQQASAPAMETTLRSPAGRKAMVYVFAAALLCVLAALLWVGGNGGALDPTKYVVLPFRAQGTPVPDVLSGSNCAELLLEALDHWDDLHLVDRNRSDDLLARTGAPTTLSQALAIAAQLGAGRLIWGDVLVLGDSAMIRGNVYRVDRRQDDPIQRATLPFHLSPAAVSASDLFLGFGNLAKSLMIGSIAGAGGPVEISAGTNLIQALLANLQGDSLLAQWNFDDARRMYQQAVAIDPHYVKPRLGLALLGLFGEDEVSSWRGALEPALVSPTLSPADRLAAEGLAALADGDYPRGCERYRALIQRDSSSFVGWFGLGECQIRDDLVVPDERAASGYRFRSSYESGLRAQRRALALVSLSHNGFGGAAVGRLAYRLFAEPNRMRGGRLYPDSSFTYAAYAGLNRDTLTFEAAPIGSVLKGLVMPASHDAAVRHSRQTLLAITSNWARAFPNSRSALRAHAVALELSGRVGGASDSGSALATLIRLRSLPETGGDAIELRAWHVRLLVGTGEFTRARSLADSALSLAPLTGGDAVLQAGLAALTGQVDRAAQIVSDNADRIPFFDQQGDTLHVSTRVVADALRLLVYASTQSPSDSLVAIRNRLRRTVELTVPTRDRQRALAAVLNRPTLLAFPVLGLPGGESDVGTIEAAVARGDSARVRTLFGSLDSMRSGVVPGSVTIDMAVLETRLRLMVGDTAEARIALTNAVDLKVRLGPDVISDLPQAAALMRAQRVLNTLGEMDASGIEVLWASSY